MKETINVTDFFLQQIAGSTYYNIRPSIQSSHIFLLFLLLLPFLLLLIMLLLLVGDLLPIDNPLVPFHCRNNPSSSSS